MESGFPDIEHLHESIVAQWEPQVFQMPAPTAGLTLPFEHLENLEADLTVGGSSDDNGIHKKSILICEKDGQNLIDIDG